MAKPDCIKLAYIAAIRVQLLWWYADLGAPVCHCHMQEPAGTLLRRACISSSPRVTALRGENLTKLKACAGSQKAFPATTVPDMVLISVRPLRFVRSLLHVIMYLISDLLTTEEYREA